MIFSGVKNTEIQNIHEKTLYILENIGVDFEHKETIELLKNKNVKIEGNRVFFSKENVEQSLSTIKSNFEVKTPYDSVKIGDGGRAIVSASGSLSILKDKVSQIPTIEDYINGRKLDQTSSVINMVCAPFINIGGLPKDKEALIKTALSLKYSNKPVIAYCSDKKESEETIELIRSFYGVDSGMYTLGVGNVISPLKYGKDNVESILAFVNRNLPVVITCCSMPGLTSPITIGGTIVQNNAEVLAGIVMTQIVNPGTPVVYGNCSFGTDMRYATPASGAMEVAIIAKYVKAMADYYKIPCRIGGSFTDAKEMDWQAGAECAASLFATLENNSDFMFHACGELDGLNIFSMEKFLLDEEIISSYISLENRDYFTDESIDVESISNVGPGGNYLFEEKTLTECRNELFIPKTYNREIYENWKTNGQHTVLYNAKTEVKKRLDSYKTIELTLEQEKIISEILTF